MLPDCLRGGRGGTACQQRQPGPCTGSFPLDAPAPPASGFLCRRLAGQRELAGLPRPFAVADPALRETALEPRSPGALMLLLTSASCCFLGPFSHLLPHFLSLFELKVETISSRSSQRGARAGSVPGAGVQGRGGTAGPGCPGPGRRAPEREGRDEVRRVSGGTPLGAGGEKPLPRVPSASSPSPSAAWGRAERAPGQRGPGGPSPSPSPASGGPFGAGWRSTGSIFSADARRVASVGL